MAHAKDIVGLDCGAGVAGGARLVMTTRLAEMCDLRAAALDWSDMEGVHDMRVASRRLRSATHDFMPYFRKRHLRSLRDAVKRVANALGDVRDEDVAIAALENMAAEAPEDVAAGIERLADERRRRREASRAALAASIGEEQTATLLRDGIATLENADAARQAKRHADDPAGRDREMTFREAGRQIIERRWRGLQEASDCLQRPLKSKPLHFMRIVAKRFRYALELFSPCWNDALAPFAEEVAELQSSLGDLHDCDEWIETLGQRLRTLQRQRETAEGGPVSTEVRVQDRRAAVWLMSRFVKMRDKNFRAALERWHAWDDERFAADLSTRLDTPHDSEAVS